MPNLCTDEVFRFQAWNLARTNLTKLGQRSTDSFRADLHRGLQTEFVPVRKDLAKPGSTRAIGAATICGSKEIAVAERRFSDERH